MGHVTEDGEDGKPRDEASDAVDGAGEQGVPGERITVSSSCLTLPNLLIDHGTTHGVRSFSFLAALWIPGPSRSCVSTYR